MGGDPLEYFFRSQITVKDIFQIRLTEKVNADKGFIFPLAEFTDDKGLANLTGAFDEQAFFDVLMVPPVFPVQQAAVYFFFFFYNPSGFCIALCYIKMGCQSSEICIKMGYHSNKHYIKMVYGQMLICIKSGSQKYMCNCIYIVICV